MTGKVRSSIASNIALNNSISNAKVSHRFSKRNDSLQFTKGTLASNYSVERIKSYEQLKLEFKQIGKQSSHLTCKDEEHENTPMKSCESKSLLHAKNLTDQLASRMLQHYDM